ncbi:MFS transporter [Propionicimonas sp.]|uniref:MFS transporter n=1 Tax=Propionicimonas sp. TaxID=1955623 RepID=UPI0039E378B5
MAVAVDGVATPDRRWRTFSALAAAAALTIFDVSKVGVALPAIQSTMGGSPSIIQFMLVGYTLAYAATLLPSGRIGDVLPRRTVFLIGSTVFLLASMVCALAPSVEWLVMGRIVEGIGAGLLMPQVLGLIQRTFPARERAKPLAALAATLSLTSLVSPVLAGAVMGVAGDALGWRLLFWISIAVTAVVLPYAAVSIREPAGETRHGFDAAGTVLLVGAVAFTIAPLSSISESLAIQPWMIAMTAVGIGFVVAFVLHERRLARSGAEPLVDPDLFRLPHLPAGVLVSGCMHAAATAGTLIVTVGLQQIGTLSALSTALWMLPSAGAALFGSWVASRFSATSGPIVAIGTGLGALGLATQGFAFGTLDTAHLPPVVGGLLVLSSFGSGVAAPSNQARTLQRVPDYRSSVAGSLIQFAQRVGSAIGMALALILYYALFSAPTFAGRPASGPMVALWAVSGFLVLATVLAAADLRRGR